MQPMRVCIALALSAAATLLWNAAFAFPDGAPWGAADPAAEQSCASCHFGTDPVRNSPALLIRGLPRVPKPGSSYDLDVVFADPDTVVAGFQMLARSAERSAGTFAATMSDVEVVETAVRSIIPISSNKGVSWSVKWRAPDVVADSIVFYVAALSADDDGSPFGYTVHFRTYRLVVA